MQNDGRIDALRNAAPVFVDVIEAVGDEDRIAVFGYGAIPDEYDPTALGHGGVCYTTSPLNLYPADDTWCGVKEANITEDFDFLRAQVLTPTTLIADKYNGWTPTGAALRDSAHYLNSVARDDVDRVIVLMSDGLANRPEITGRRSRR